MSFALGGNIYYIVSVLVLIVTTVIVLFKWRFRYWQQRGLQTLDPVVLLGDTKGLIMKKLSLGEQYQEFYNKFKARGLRHGGIYNMGKPNYIPVDPEIIKCIMQKDFQHFVNRGIFTDEIADPLTGNLFFLEDAKWRHMRTKLTPTFTSGKMKMMFQTLVDCTAGLKDIMDDSVKGKNAVDIKEILGRFTTDIIGSCAFGLDCNSLKDPEAEFRKYGKSHFDITPKQRLKLLIQFILPHALLRKIGFRLTKPEVEKFFMGAIKATVDYREKHNVFRKDFLHLLLQLKNRGTVADDGSITNETGEITEKALTINELAAQAFVFFIAGFETSSTTMTFALYELAINPHVQDKLREEITSVLARYNNQVTYDAIMDMTYMDRVIYETLRKYPPVPVLFRKCTEDYRIPETSVVIKKGILAFISVLGLQYDAEYYPDPEKFDPDRFTEENKNKRPAFTWLPFGDGPRICIGMRFGMMQSKVGLAALLRDYKIKLNNRTKTPLSMQKASLITATEGGIWLDVEKI